MMLVAHPLAMPSTVHNSKKRKGHHNDNDLLPSKKAALDHQAMAERKEIAGVIERGKMLFPIGVHQNEETNTSKGYLEKRKAGINAKRALRLHSHDSGSGDVAHHHQKTMKHEDKMDGKGTVKAGNGLRSNVIVNDYESSIELSEQRYEGEASLMSEDTFNDNHTLGSEVVVFTETKGAANSTKNWDRLSGEHGGGQQMSHAAAKQPSVVLTDYKLSGSGRSPNCLLEPGNYMRRMASLNARARVTAMMEPEFRRSKGAHNNGLSNKKRGDFSIHNNRPIRSPGSSMTSPLSRKRSSMLRPCSSPSSSPSSSSSSSSSSSVISFPETDFSHDSESNVTEPLVIDTLLTLAMAAATNAACDPEEVPYNNLGLLYNGDTLHSNCRVFYASDTDLTIPLKVIPKVVPSREKFVKAAIDDAISMRYVGKKKKGAKANNGWSVMGNPIKTIEYYEGSVLITRRYYTGIRRNNAKEIICVRDSVVIRSGDSTKDEKPYVAKLASIWQEQPGHLMMTVMWYYRPDEMDSSISQATPFKEDELLASQHNDDNSVACIEEKCHVLGVSQYCRYQAYIHCKRAGCISKSRSIVPSMLMKNSNQRLTKNIHDSFLAPSHTPHQLTFSKDVEILSEVDPDLVCLCHRGYNHYAGKLVSRSFSK